MSVVRDRGLKAKAERLLGEGRIERRVAQARVYGVDGDHGRYLVVMSADVAICTCPAFAHGSRCAHLEACGALERANDEQLATYERVRELHRRSSAGTA